ncbi:putative disease resistance protein RGA3 isoform X2 [Magnolia sinica]|uniref:putative disease resistance protein RGA3 isoform X2 n=1 Tax=Magnolia sinica TaxID=86752 RepID=UPI00265B535A|nr:putative disease resistance protein RGA3 isoform X2 [Magnolia sinica]
MAAEAILSAFVKTVLGNLNSLLLQEFGSAWGVKKELGKLESTLSTIHAVLQDAEEQQVKNEAVKNWLKKLKDATYVADDLIDEYAIEAFRRKVRTQSATVNRVRNFFSFPNSLVFCLRMGSRIKEIGERLDGIAAERLKFHLREGVVDRPGNTEEELQTASFVIESEVYGREKDKEKIVELLIHVSTQEDVSIIPIVSMGGLGKTTLAQFAYNDERVAKHFELRMWVCVSDDFDVRRLTKTILESATDGKHDLLELDLLQRRLQEKLRGKKFLLVLDDVWDENPENWDQLKQFLRGVRGSKIIVTTRSEKVASIMGTVPPYHLPRLSEDDCWSLFMQRAFGHGRQEPPILVMHAKEIVKKCGGIPLAAKALGGLMRFKTDEREWLFVKESEIWNIPEEENDILPALRLSYFHLSSHLKQCFAYCSIFPKDHIIDKKKLILLWMAEGFIQPSDGSKQMEDIGGEYFNNLLWRSFFQDVKKDEDGNILWCKMHDLVHDLACSVAGNKCSIVQVKNAVSIPDISRRLLMLCECYELVLTVPKASRKANHLRTLLLDGRQTFSVPRNLLTHFMCLRVLDLSLACVTTEMLVSISSLKHLRYLHMSCIQIRALPKSISTLHHLQTLILSGCHNLAELPRDMSKMTSLRHLEMSRYNKLTHMPANMGELKFLQTLSIFIDGKDSGCGMRELQGLNLGGKLTIRNLENVMCAADAQEANLKDKPNLCELRFSWGQDIDLQLEGNVEQTLEGLRPHRNLKRLTVEEYMGVRFPHWMSSSLLPNLIEVSLINCRRCEQLPPLSHLPLLKVLVIRGMDAVKSIGKHFYGDDVTEAFPSLKQLNIQDMPNLEEWSGSNGRVLPCLNRLTVWGCPKFTTLPCLPSLKELELTDGKEMLLGSVANLSSLSSLWVQGFKELRSLPDGKLGNLAALESLSIYRCDKLPLLPEELQNLSSLHKLWIDWCDGLTSLRLQGLSSLQDLLIEGCQSITSLIGGLQHLTALQYLLINDCPELEYLPEGMQHLTSLRKLTIRTCQKLTCLPEGLRHVTKLEDLSIGTWPNGMTPPEWIGNLSSLRRLEINHCDKLTCLPSGLQLLTNLQQLHIWHWPSLTALPEWIGNLSSLRYLYIWGCDKLECLPSGLQLLPNLQRLRITDRPQLEKRCKKEKGEDWHKISHIPYIEIGYPKFQSRREGKWRGRLLELKRKCINALLPTSSSN